MSPMEEKEEFFLPDLPSIVVGSDPHKTLRSISYDNSSSPYTISYGNRSSPYAIPYGNSPSSRTISLDNTPSSSVVWSEDIPIQCTPQDLSKSLSSWPFQSLEKDNSDMEKGMRKLTEATSSLIGNGNDTHDGSNGYEYPRYVARRRAFHHRDRRKQQVRHSRSLETIFKCDNQEAAGCATSESVGKV